MMGMSAREVGEKVIIAIYTKPEGRKAIKNVQDTLTKYGKAENEDVVIQAYFAVLVEELFGNDYLKELGIDESDVLPEIREEETKYRDHFLDLLLNEEIKPLSELKGLKIENIRHAFRDVKNKEAVEKLIQKTNAQ